MGGAILRQWRWWFTVLLAATVAFGAWTWRSEQSRSAWSVWESITTPHVAEWRFVARDWEAVMPTVRRAQDLAARGERARAFEVLDAGIAARVSGSGHVAALETFRLRWARWVLSREDEPPFPMPESLSILYDDRNVGGRGSVDTRAAFDALAVEAAAALVDPRDPRRALALRQVKAIGVCRGDWEEEGVAFIAAQGVATVEAIVALCSVRPVHIKSDELDAWVERDRVVAAWCVRQLADLPVALTGEKPYDAENLRGEGLTRIAAAYERILDLEPAAAFRERLKIARDELEAALAPSGEAAPDRPAISLLLRWFDAHVGRSWVAEGSAVVRVDDVERAIATFDPREFSAWLATRAGVPPGASAADLVFAMHERGAERGLLHQLLLLRTRQDVIPPTWDVVERDWRIRERWRVALGLPRERRVVNVAWLVLRGTEWVEQARFSQSLAEGERVQVRLAEELPWDGHSQVSTRLPGLPAQREDVLADEARGHLSFEITNGNVRVELSPWSFIRRERWRHESVKLAFVGRVPFVVPHELSMEVPEWTILVWADGLDDEGSGPTPWRTVLPDAVERMADAVDDEREPWRAALPIVEAMKVLPTPAAAPALRRILHHAERDVGPPAAEVGSGRHAARDIRLALLLAGDTSVLDADPDGRQAQADLFVHTDPLYWTQVAVRVDDERARQLAALCLPSHVMGDAAAGVLHAAEAARSGSVPTEFLRRAGPLRDSPSRLSRLDGRAWRAVSASIVALLLATWLLRRSWRTWRCRATTDLAAYWALVIGLVVVAVDVRFGYIDLLPDALGLAIAAAATWVLAAVAASRAARWGSRAFAAAAVVALVTDVLHGAGVLHHAHTVYGRSAFQASGAMDVAVALLTAVGVMTLAPLAADLVRGLVPETGAAPRRAVMRSGLREWGTTIAAAVLVVWILRRTWGGLAVGLLFSEIPIRTSEVPIGDVLLYLLALAVRPAIVGAVAVGLILGRAGLRRGGDMTALPILFVLGLVPPIAFHMGSWLADSGEDLIGPLWGTPPFFNTCVVAAVVWCVLRLLDAVRVRGYADRNATPRPVLQ